MTRELPLLCADFLSPSVRLDRRPGFAAAGWRK
jgi:hypothetical protein